MSTSRRSRPRRRTRRVSDASDYDRTADDPAEGAWADVEPEVADFISGEVEPVIEDDHDKEAADRLFDDRPPHYGNE